MKKLSKLTAARAPISFAIKANIAAVLLAVVVVVPSQAAGPYIYVANAGEDTVSKIDVTLSQGQEVARYATWFTSPDPNYVGQPHSPWWGPAPSRIARDSTGNVYVLNRMFGNVYPPPGPTPPAHLPVLLKIVPNGGPTSAGSGFGAILPITDTITSAPINIDSGEAKDARIVWAKPVGTTGSDEGKVGRAVCTDTSGFLWVGVYYSHKYYKVDPNTGIMTGVSVSTGTHTPYGCQVDINGKLWSVDEAHTLAEIDTRTNTLVNIFDHSTYGYNYSLSLFNDCSVSPPKVTVYLSDQSGKAYIAYDPQTNTFSNPFSPTPPLSSVAIAVDSQGNIISGGAAAGGRIIKTTPSHTLLWDTGTFPPSSTQYVQNIHGMIVDDNDDIWAVDLYGNASSSPNGRVLKYSSSGAFIKALTIGASPYTYGNTPPATCTGATPTPTPTPSPTPTPTPPPCGQVTGETRCLPNRGYSYTFTVTNNSGSAMSQILLTPVQGSTFTLTPQLTNLPTPLQNGQSTTVTTNISNLKQGDKVCFFVSLISEKAPCCNVQVCLTLPRCGVIETATPPPPTRQQRPPPPSRQGRRRR